MIQEYDKVMAELEPDEIPAFDESGPVTIFNHRPFHLMSLREFRELEESWP